MEDNKNKELESLIDSIMKSDSLESPSKDFTSNVMQHIDVLENKRALVYKPLISKKTWVLLTILLLSIIGYGFYGSDSTSESWLGSINWNVLLDNSLLNQIGEFSISTTLIYAVVFLGIMLGIQIPLLNNHLNKKLGV